MAEKTVLENDFLRLDVVTDPTLGLSVTDKRSGTVWACPGPPFALHYWDAKHFDVRRCPTDRSRGWEFRVTPDEAQIAVQCTWPRAACGFQAVFQLEGALLQIRLRGRRMVENRSFEVRQMAIDVLHGFGGARTGEDGFLLAPHGRGALCRFDKTVERETAMLVYAGGDRGLNAPVFGMARGTAGFIGIVKEGEFNAELVLTANGGPDRTLNFVHPRIRVRFHSADTLDEDAEYRLSYHFLPGPDVSYVAMANAYRNYLTETRGYASFEERVQVRPGLARLAAATTVRVDLAEKRRLTRMTGDGELQVKTTFDQAAELAQSLHEAGVENAVVTLCGWNCEGRDGLYPTRFPVESAVGGADAMNRALKTIRGLGFMAGAVDNFTDAYRRSPAFNENCNCHQLGGEPWRGGVWAGGQAYVICPAEARERYAQRDMRRLHDLGLEGLLYLDHCPPGVLQCYHEDHPLTRAGYARQVREVIKMAETTFGVCRISGLSVFAALEADSCMCPVQNVPDIDGLESEWFADESVPFLPIVLHGLVLLAGDAGADLLRVVEYGAAPVFVSSAATFNHDLGVIAEFARRYATELAPLASEFIESYETPREGLAVVRYSGGAEVLVNRTDAVERLSGVEVGRKDFRVKK